MGSQILEKVMNGKNLVVFIAMLAVVVIVTRVIKSQNFPSVNKYLPNF